VCKAGSAVDVLYEWFRDGTAVDTARARDAVRGRASLGPSGRKWQLFSKLWELEGLGASPAEIYWRLAPSYGFRISLYWSAIDILDFFSYIYLPYVMRESAACRLHTDYWHGEAC